MKNITVKLLYSTKKINRERISSILGNLIDGEKSENISVLTVEEDGYVGQLEKGYVLVTVFIPNGHGLHAFTVDGNKTILPCRDWATVLEAEKLQNNSVHTICVPIIKTEPDADGQVVSRTRHAQNNIRILKLDADGEFFIYQVSLVSQNGNFFLVTELCYNESCYVDENSVVFCPFFDKNYTPAEKSWPDFVDYITHLYSVDYPYCLQYFDPISEYKYEEMDLQDVPDGCGKVFFWNSANGTGCILTPDEAIKVHWSQIKRTERRAYLKPSEIVKISKINSPVTNTTSHPSSFEKEALGVELCS